MKNILVVVDFSEDTSQVIRHSINLATALSAQVYLIHALAPNEGLDGGASDDVTKDFPEETRQLTDLANTLRHQNIETHAILAAGIAHQVIIHEANSVDADLIITGSRGYGALASVVMGDVTLGILKHTKIPVLFIPEQG